MATTVADDKERAAFIRGYCAAKAEMDDAVQRGVALGQAHFDRELAQARAEIRAEIGAIRTRIETERNIR